MYSLIGAPSQITALRCNSSAALRMAPVDFFIFGVVVGYGIRENISRRRHAAVAAREERRREQLSADHNLPRPE
jgi:hypothetical protein